MFQPKLSDGTLYFVKFFAKIMAFVSCREITVHCTRLRRQLRLCTGCMNARRSVHCKQLTARRQRHESDSTQDDLPTPRSLQFFNSPNIHSCKLMPPIHSIKSLWFCPLEIEFAISCPELSPCTVTRLRKTEFISSAVRDGLTCVKSNCFYARL